MRLLLDTHAFLWWLGEVAVRLQVGKLQLGLGKVVEAVPRCGFSLLAIEGAHSVALAALPSHHRDPFDHLLIAQAISEAATLVSGDRHVPLYPVRFVTCA